MSELVALRLPSRSRSQSVDDSPAVTSGETKRRVYLETYGCQMNVADTDLLTGILERQGFAKTATPDDAQLILVNTCAVREKAEERVFARLRELRTHKRRGDVVLGLLGCMAEHLKTEVLSQAPYIDLIAGPDSYRRLPDLVGSAAERLAPSRYSDEELAALTAKPPKKRRDPFVDVTLDREETYEGLDGAIGGNGVSGFISIQRGCDKFCTFCVVPFTRGRERSLAPGEVIRQAHRFVEAGYKELTLLGQTVNSYHHEDTTFAKLLRRLATETGIERIRFTSPYPIDFDEELIATLAEEPASHPKICPHVHLPLQSASEPLLERMRRGYTYEQFRQITSDLRKAIPHVAITTDIIAGFCGETEADHARTLEALDEQTFDNAFFFAYSERSGTAAAKKLPDDVPLEVKQRRLAEVISRQEPHSRQALAKHVGETVPVLLHGVSKRNDQELIGRTATFKAVIVPAGNLRPGDLVNVRVDRATPATLLGTPV